MNYKRLSFFLILILFAFNSIYAVSRDFLSAYPSFEISEEINEDDLGLDFLSLFSYSQKKIVILCVNQNDPSDAQVLLESDYPLNWCSSTIGFSQKSQTFYFSLNGAEDENGFYKYQELYAVPAENKKFLSQNVQHLYVPEGWLFDRCVNFYLKDENYKGLLDYFYSLGESGEKKFCVQNGDELLTEEAALKFCKENNLFYDDAYNFFNTHLRKTQNGKLTEKSAFTLYGKSAIKNTIAQENMCDAVFLQNDEGFWLLHCINEEVDGKWIPSYFKIYLLENSDGLIAEKTQIL